MNVPLILANMEAVSTWSMTILVNVVLDTREEIVMKVRNIGSEKLCIRAEMFSCNDLVSCNKSVSVYQYSN